MYRPVPARIDLPAMERDVLAFWHEHKIFDRTLEQTAGGPLWVFYEGPPTANGKPGTHHVEARVFKDVFPRFKTMNGYHVPRKAGWDCHGLPVELEVEKELGFSGKGDIEAFGIAEFNARCRESVERHVDAFEEMTLRMGYWVDMSAAYRTMDPEYVDAVWWSLARVFDAGLLVQDHRVAPYCPRCGTGLSDHELAQGYETISDPSVFVRFPLTSGPLADQGAQLLVWTTTPWTLVSNTAVAVHPDLTYVAARKPDGSGGGELFVVAEDLVGEVLGEDATVLGRFPGREMERWTYHRPFELVDVPDAHIVVLGDYVTTDDGTGLVHQAPAFGADDLAVCRTYGLPVVNPVRSDGTFAEDVPLVGGQFFKHADPALVDDLDRRGLLYRHVSYEHAYPHCWRCHTPLIYYAQPSWYIRTTARKDALLRENERTTWYPASMKWGRYGQWLEGNVDWALSRNRYWGTPLPIWRCEQGHLTRVESRAELGALAGRDLSGLDPHRPYVDEVLLACPAPTDDGGACGLEARRVSEVIDAWYDSGSMPFAQWGYPHTQGSAERFGSQYPAQFICEAIDQTRGWFYTLMAVGTLVYDRSSYENVLVLGHILDAEGRKMSKHLGNVLEPLPLMERHGADAVRWFMAASGSPWVSRRVGHEAIQEVVRQVLLTYWNTVAFHALYARTGGWTPASGAPEPASRPMLDRWVLSELQQLVGALGDAFESFDTQRAGRLLAAFVDDLSNWYVRRSRRRFWQADPSAFATLHQCLEVLTRLLAPMVPFVSERVWQDLVRPVTPDAPESVHLSTWPRVDAALLDPTLGDSVALARRLVELGRAARADSGVRTRQPLGRALVGAAGWHNLPDELRREVADELNVVTLEPLSAAGDEVVDRTVKPNFRALGRRFAARTPAVAAAIAAADPTTLAEGLAAGSATVLVEGERVGLDAQEVVVTEVPRAGWAVAHAGGESMALDLEITPELRRAGLAREIVRLVQDARKSRGFAVEDRVRLWWSADGEVADAMRHHAGFVADEVLAVEVSEGAPEDPALVSQVRREDALGLSLWLHRLP